MKTTTSATRRDRNLFIFDIFFVGVLTFDIETLLNVEEKGEKRKREK